MPYSRRSRLFLPLCAAALGISTGTAPLGAQVHRVSPEGPLRTISAAIAAAGAGDTVRVAAGVYPGSLEIDRPLTLLGEGRPVIDGGGSGHVIDARAAVTVRGFEIRGSGSRVDTEDAGIMVRDAPARIEDNVFEDVLYGVYLKAAPRSVVSGNHITGKPFPLPRRGDGIRLWRSSSSRVSGNRVERARDVVIYFSDSLEVADNTIVDGRYGLHYMYSHYNLIRGNRFERDEVGAFIMYSHDVTIQRNVFADSRGSTGMGLGLKDADRIHVADNLVWGNAVGIHLDNTPSDPAKWDLLEGNRIALNVVGVRLLPSVTGNRFIANDFVANERPVEAAGGVRDGFAAQNRFLSNHWSSYVGFDGDGDGTGDLPFVRARLADEILASHPRLGAFSGSPALDLLDVLTRFFPLLKPTPVVIDSAPRISAYPAGNWTPGPENRVSTSGAMGGWLVLSGVAFGLIAFARVDMGRLGRSGRA